jgi:hypothetical protein
MSGQVRAIRQVTRNVLRLDTSDPARSSVGTRAVASTGPDGTIAAVAGGTLLVPGTGEVLGGAFPG